MFDIGEYEKPSVTIEPVSEGKSTVIIGE